MSDSVIKNKCEKCGKQFATVSLINRHKSKKIPCNSEAKQEYIDNKKKCRYCNKMLSTYYNTKHHEKICKKNLVDCNEIDNKSDTVQNNIETCTKNEDNFEIVKIKLVELTRQIEEMKLKQTEETNKLQEEIQKLNKRKKNKITVTNNNNVINNINNFNITAYGKETCEHISDSMFKNILNEGFKSVPMLVEQIHFNKNKPEYHNVYISNIRDNNALIYDGEKWMLSEREAIIDNMMDAKNYILSDKFDELKESLEEKTIRKFQRFLDACDTDIVKSQIKNDLKLSLYNNKQISENTKQRLVSKT